MDFSDSLKAMHSIPQFDKLPTQEVSEKKSKQMQEKSTNKSEVVQSQKSHQQSHGIDLEGEHLLVDIGVAQLRQIMNSGGNFDGDFDQMFKEIQDPKATHPGIATHRIFAASNSEFKKQMTHRIKELKGEI